MHEAIHRRDFIGLTLATMAVGATPAWAAPAPIQVYRDPGCGCCEVWTQKLKVGLNRPVRLQDSKDMQAVKRRLGVPKQLSSCHTAVIDGFVIEGHVPAADIARLLKTRPKGVKGLGVPGMPMGSPGMDQGHDMREAYTVFAFDASGKRWAFARHGA